jgi:hypothetical protein
MLSAMLDELAGTALLDSADGASSFRSPLRAPAVGRSVEGKGEGATTGGSPRSSRNVARAAKPAPRRWGLYWLAACLLLAAYLGYRAWPRTAPGNPLAAPVASAALVSASAPRGTSIAAATKPIEEIRLGDRVAGRNPLAQQVDDAPEPDPATWRVVRLELTKDDGSKLWADLLRPQAWLELEGVAVGGTLALDLPEMGAVGQADVLGIEPCPPIQAGSGNVVTGLFRHQATGRNVVALRLEGQAEPTGVTTNHPYWSEDRQEFVEAGELQIGERLWTRTGETRVESVAPLDYQGLLYNLEVHNEHVYLVDALGTLVHNNCITGSIRGKTPNKVARDILKREPSWKKVPVDRGHGWKIVDANGTERIRYMYPQKKGFYPHERTGYFVRQDEAGRFLDIDGRVIPDGLDQITLRHLPDTSL